MVDVRILAEIDDEMRADGVPHHQRPFEAIARLSTRKGICIAFPSPHADEIIDWFKSRAKPEASAVGSLYRSVFFFDAEFWPVDVPISYGTVSISPTQSLTGMPLPVQDLVHQAQGADYAMYWADCVDYGLGFDDLRGASSLDAYGMELFAAADQELRSSVSLLLERRPNSRSILTTRMAVEIFMKAYIALKVGLSEKEAKDIGHNLKEGLARFCYLSGLKGWLSLAPSLQVFPEIGSRYTQQNISRSDLWLGFSIAQSLAAVVVRQFTDRHIIDQVMRALGR